MYIRSMTVGLPIIRLQKNNIDVVLIPGEIESVGMANRDIEAGEEILVNYRMFDSHDQKSEERYLNG